MTLAALGALLVLLPGAGAPKREVPDSPQAAVYESILDALETWDIPRAEKLVDQAFGPLSGTASSTATGADQGDPETRITLALRGRVAFFKGNYAEAALLLRGTEDQYGKLAEATAKETEEYVEQDSPHFALRYPKGKDAILVPYALETLELARERIGKDLGILPEGRIRVEVLRDPKVLARLSPLTEQQIKTSGTIALCKYNKLMLVSPRALITGYPWQDTLAHELTHYLITRKSENKTPIWLHEGIAKFEESRWRGAAGQALSPATAALLDQRLRQNTLISFERMHPSIALLPSQEDAAVAFAEVFTTIEYLVRERHASLDALLTALRQGKSETRAVELVANESFDQLTHDWKAYLRRRPTPREVLPLEHLRFRDERDRDGRDDERKRLGAHEVDAAELGEIEDRGARRLAHLGSLFFARSRVTPALAELEKAEARVGARSPALSNLYARVLMEAGEGSLAGKVLQESLVPYPDIAQTHLHLGEVEVVAKHWAAAKEQLLDANAIDPFDPAIHAGLLRVAKETNDQAGAATETEALTRLEND